MKRTPLYSAAGSRRPAAATAPAAAPPAAAAAAPAAASEATPAAPSTPVATPPAGHGAARGARRARWAWAGGGLLAGTLVAALALTAARPPLQRLTQKDIDKAVLHTLSTKPLPAPAAKAAAVIRPSVVRVVATVPHERRAAAKDDEDDGSVGTGVVITDRGVILTNLHVVAGARRIKVTFFDGLEADAQLVNVQPENDLAVLQAAKLPDDLTPATMRSTGDLRPGDRVTAVGFPFGIGPSVSHGVVSGLKREFRSPDGKQVLTNLIQFDAAANPGNSGGPLVTDEGEVVGIVTAILNPVQQRFFVGIGFAVPIENAAAGAGMPPF